MTREIKQPGPSDYVRAARVPKSLDTQSFGLWTIRRVYRAGLQPIAEQLFYAWVGFDSMTLLHRLTTATMMHPYGEVVMEDSLRELRRHLPIWLAAHGRVLVTGLGLGCVVRGLLASPYVKYITVVELDGEILRVVGEEFQTNRRITLIHGDALTVKIPGTFDFAWHDIWTEGPEHLQILHVKLLRRFEEQCDIQGAWQLPREFKRRAPGWVLR